MDEQLLNRLAHEAYEIEEEIEIQNSWQDYKMKQTESDDKMKQIEIADMIAAASVTQYYKDNGHVDEMDELVKKQKKIEQNNMSWSIQIATLEKEVTNAGFISAETMQNCTKQHNEEELLDDYHMDQFEQEIEIEKAVKSIEKHNHVLPMDEVKKEIEECVEKQLQREEMIGKYIQDYVAKENKFNDTVAKWENTQNGKQNTNPFFLSTYRFQAKNSKITCANDHGNN